MTYVRQRWAAEHHHWRVKPEPHEERVAREIMSRLLGVAVERHDDNSVDGMVDFVFSLPGGRRGVAEMTSITDPLAREWASLARKSFEISGSMWAWMVRRRGARVSLKEVEQHLPVLAALAEQADDPEVRNLLRGAAHGTEPALEWLATSRVEIRGIRGSSHPGKVYLEADPSVSFVPDSLADALVWIEQELGGPAFDPKFAKLAAAGVPEQHLVLRLDVGAAVPSEHWFALVDDGVTLPIRSPHVEGRYLTGLWLLPDFSRSIVYWTSTHGWRRELIQAMD